MDLIRNKTIATKISTVIAMFILLACGLVGVGAYGIQTNDDTVQDAFSNQVRALSMASDANEKASHMHQRAFEVLVETDQSRWNEMQSAFLSQVDDLVRIIDSMKSSLDVEDLVHYNAFKPDIEDYKKSEVKAFDLQKSGKRSEAEDQLQGEVSDRYSKLAKELKDFASRQANDMNDARDHIHEVSHKTLVGMVATGVVGLALTMVAALLLVRSQISRPIASMTQAMSRLAAGEISIAVPALGQKDEIGAMAAAVQTFKDAAIEKIRVEVAAAEARRLAEDERTRNEAERAAAAEQQAAVVDGIATGLEHLADGDLAFRLHTAFATEYDKLRTNFNGALGKLQETMKVVATSAAAIRSGSTEISTAADDLSKRTEQQAASLEETAAALDEITATVKKTSEGAVHARQVVSTAKTDAERSGDVVGQAVQAMAEIEKSSQQVNQIIGVIDEIAFQTNLLALNAGVEAARAGEAGRGFAVVASEVRALAQRSAEAAKEIKALISASAAQVGQGVNLVSETGRSLARIVGQVTEINAVVSDIASSAQEQATGLEQVNTAINQMDQVVQQNAAMVEESTAASHSLSQEAQELARLIGRFQLGGEPGGMRAVPSRNNPSRAVGALKFMGRGGAAPKPDVATEAAWEEF